MAGKQNWHKRLVVSLDVLISDPEILEPGPDTDPKAELLIIPKSYITRLNELYQENNSRGEACRELMRIFNDIFAYMHHNNVDEYEYENGMKLKFVDIQEKDVPHGLEREISSSKAQAIIAALQEEHKTKGTSDTAVMTGSDQVSTMAYMYGVDVAHVNPDVYNGRRMVSLPENLYTRWFSAHKITLEEWIENEVGDLPVANEYFEFTCDEWPLDAEDSNDYRFQSVGRYDAKVEAIVPLRLDGLKDLKFNIWPKNAGQAMVFDALFAPPEEAPIVILPGIFGTGKTFMACAAGLIQAERDVYERIFICPRDGALGKDIGFLPGDETTKTRAKSKPIEDNFREVLKTYKCDKQKGGKVPEDEKNLGRRQTLDKRVEDTLARYCEFEPLVNMGGRSISDSFMIYDEFQDMERHQAKALLTRIGEHSKVVIIGDPAQRTNPHVNATSNGLSYSASKLKGDPQVYVIAMKQEEIVRSMVLRTIAKRLEH